MRTLFDFTVRKTAFMLSLSLGSFLFAQEAQDEEAAPAPSPPEAPAPPAPQAPVGPPNTSREFYQSIVRVENTSLVPDYQAPWNSGRQGGGTGTAFYIGNNRFLTNAHVVSNSIRILLKKVGDPEKYPARIKHIAHDCDLAMLELEDASTMEDAPALEVGEIPSLESTVTVIGYPLGGRRLSTTRGVVSRIDFQPYSHSAADLHLTVQIDAAINPGNSGGPVVQDGKVVGVAFQGLSSAAAANVGYMIPTPVIQRFLKDVEDGYYDRYVDLALSNFELINPVQRAALGLPQNGVGTLITSVISGGSCEGILEDGDVVLEIDGYPVAANGFVEMNGEFVDMNEIVERKFRGDKVKIKVLRNREMQDLEVELKPFNPYLIQANRYDERPKYVVFAGLVFQPMDRNLLAAHGITNIQARYHYNYYAEDEIYKKKPDILILTSVLPDAINTEYRGFIHNVVDKVNGQEVKTIQELYDALNSSETPDFFRIDFAGSGLPLILDGKLVKEAHGRVKEKYGIGLDHYLGDDAETID